MEGQQPTPPDAEQPQAPQEPPKPTALEVRNRYAIRAVIFLALTIWFGYDGWFNPEIHSKTFNKVGAVLFGAYMIFCIAMMTSAQMALKNQPPEPPAPPES